MRYLAVLSLLAVVLFTFGFGIRVADDEEMEAIADTHHKVARALFINPSGTYATRTRVSTYSRSTRSSGSTRAAARPEDEALSPFVEGVDFTSTICRQAYTRVFDQCLTVQGLNLDDLLEAFSSNNATLYMPLLNRLVNILCRGGDCWDSILNASRACIPGLSSRPLLENALDVVCKVNEFGSTCANTFITAIRIGGSFVSACQATPTADCSRFDSPCRSLLQEVSKGEGCCALETYQLYKEAFNLFSGNSTGSSLSFPPNPWTACGLPSPGLCPGGFTIGTPIVTPTVSSTVTTSTKPPVTVSCTPRPKVTSTTIFTVIGRVWPHTDSRRFITVQRSYRPPSTTFSVLPGSSTQLQHWAIVSDSDLQSRNQFAIVSYPVPNYIVCLNSTNGYSYRLVLERIPFWRYVHGGPFYNPGCNCTFTTGNCYVDSRLSGEYIQHVSTGLVLTHNFGSNLSLQPLQRNAYGQCWVHPLLQKRLRSISLRRLD